MVVMDVTLLLFVGLSDSQRYARNVFSLLFASAHMIQQANDLELQEWH